MERNQRFKDADWMDVVSNSSVIIGGAGGIGSWLALYLSRSGIKEVVIVDMDTVTIQNLGGQFFANSQIGHTKVEAVSNLLNNFCDHNFDICSLPQRIENMNLDFYYYKLGYFACFDNMGARKEMYNQWKENSSVPNAIFIDGRMLAEGYQIAVVTKDPKRMTIYEQEFMQSDNQIPDLPCTIRATSHAASMLAGAMFGIFTNHCANIQAGIEYRDVPMFYEFDIPMMNSTLLFPCDYDIEQPDSPTELKGFTLIPPNSEDITSIQIDEAIELVEEVV